MSEPRTFTITIRFKVDALNPIDAIHTTLNNLIDTIYPNRDNTTRLAIWVNDVPYTAHRDSTHHSLVARPARQAGAAGSD